MTLTAELQFEALDACPICGYTEIPPLIPIQHYGIRTGYSNCQNCGLLFLNPRMTDEQTTAYYAGIYRDALIDNFPGFMDHDTQLQHDRAAKQLKFLEPIVTGRMKTDMYTVAMGRMIDKALDIGSSLGYLMDGLYGLGVTCCEGVEPDARYHSYYPANKYKCYRDISEIVPGEKYDLIAMSHSLEHLNHPREFLTDLLTAHAHSNTLVMVDVPNTECNRGSYRIHHPMAFTPFTLTGLFERIGWRQTAMHFYGREVEGPGKRYMLGFYRRTE